MQRETSKLKNKEKIPKVHVKSLTAMLYHQPAPSSSTNSVFNT